MGIYIHNISRLSCMSGKILCAASLLRFKAFSKLRIFYETKDPFKRIYLFESVQV